MKALTLINLYRDNHAGKSSQIDTQLGIAEQNIKDSKRNLDRGDTDFSLVNLFLARKTLCNLLEAIPAPDAVRKQLIDIYAAIDNAICEIQGI